MHNKKSCFSTLLAKYLFKNDNTEINFLLFLPSFLIAKPQILLGERVPVEWSRNAEDGVCFYFLLVLGAKSMCIYKLEILRIFSWLHTWIKFKFSNTIIQYKEKWEPCLQHKSTFFCFERHLGRSNHGKMKQQLQKKRKSFEVLCTWFFWTEDSDLQDPYVSSWSWMKRHVLITITIS